MDPLHKVTIPLGKTVTFSFEIDGKKVEIDKSEFVDTVDVKPSFDAAQAVLNNSSFKAPSQIPMITKAGTPPPPAYAPGVFLLKLTSKQVKQGKVGVNSTYKFLCNGSEVANDPDPGKQYPYHYLTRHANVKQIQWKLVTPSGTGTITAQLVSPDSGEVSCTGTGTVVSPYFLEVTVMFQLQVLWPEEYPPFVNDGKDDVAWKSDSKGRLTLATFYGMYKELPDTITNNVKNVRFKRRVMGGNHAGFMDQYWWEIIIRDKDIAPNGKMSTISYYLLHEMGHASHFARAGDGWTQNGIAFLTIMTEVGSIGTLSAISAAASGAALITVIPAIVAAVAIEWIFAATAMRRDFMSDWSAESDWRCYHFGWHAIPIIGHFISVFHKTEPNIFFAADTCMRNYFGLQNIELSKQSGDWAKAGMVSEYASTNPMDDFAESFASYIMNASFLKSGAGHLLKLTDNSGGRGRFLKKTYYPDGVKELDEIVTTKYEELDFDIENHRKAKLKTQGAPDHEIMKAFAILGKMQEEWDSGSGPLFERNREIMAKLAVPVRQNPTPLELLRTLELHGNGWKFYEGKEQVVAKGDMVADATQQTWMISVTDEQERLKQVAGGFAYKKGMKPEDLVKDHSYFKLTWSPAAEKRNWLSDGQKASPHYKDLDAVFTHMIRLWGEQQAPESGRKMNSCKEFLHEWLHTAEMWNTSFPFNPDAGIREAMNYLESHGKGLQVFDPTSITPAPGDLLIPYHRSSLGMVTRVDAAKQTVDVLESGTFDKGMLGEPADSARMRYGIPFNEFQYYWAPSPETRQLT